MACSSSRVERCTPRRICFSVRAANQRSTRFSQEALVLRPRERVACVTKLFACGFPVELPVDEHASAVRPAIPRAALPAECRQIGDSSFAEALPGKQADLDFCLVEPASVFGRVVHGEAIPQGAAALLA